MSTVHLGILHSDVVANAISRYLANTYLLLLKTQNFHWNVTGENFYSLHGLFELQYTELQAAVDELAERIQKLGKAVPASFASFAAAADLKESTGSPAAMEMVALLLKDHERMSCLGREFIATAQTEKDEATADLLVARLHAHEKAAWMLRATLQK